MVPEILKTLCAFLLGPSFARHLGEPAYDFLKTQVPPTGSGGGSGKSKDNDYSTFEDPPFEDDTEDSQDTTNPRSPQRKKKTPPSDTPLPTGDVPQETFGSQGTSEDIQVPPELTLPIGPPPLSTPQQEYGPVFIPANTLESILKQSHMSRLVSPPARRFRLEEFTPTLRQAEDGNDPQAVEKWADQVRIGVVEKKFEGPGEYDQAKRSLWLSTLLYSQLGAKAKMEEGFQALLRLGALNGDLAAPVLVLAVRKILEGDLHTGMTLLKTIENQSTFAAELLHYLLHQAQTIQALRGLNLLETYLAEKYDKKIDAAASVWGKLTDETERYRLQEEQKHLLGEGQRLETGPPSALRLVQEVLLTGKVGGLEEAIRLVSGEVSSDALVDFPLLRSRIANLSSSTQSLLRHILTDPNVAELVRIAQMEHDGLRSQTYLSLADSFLEERDFPRTALSVYQFLSGEGTSESIAAPARSRLKAMRGEGTQTEMTDFFIRGFLRGVASPSGVFAMTCAGGAFRLGRLAFLGNEVNAGRLFLGTVAGTTLEVPAFVFSHRAMESIFSSDSQIWNQREIVADLKRSALMFGLSKVAGNLSNNWTKSLQGDPFLATPSGQIYLHTVQEPLQMAAFVGAQRISRQLGWAQAHSTGVWGDLLEGGINYFQARATASLSQMIATPYESTMRTVDFLRRFEKIPQGFKPRFNPWGQEPSDETSDLLPPSQSGPLLGDPTLLSHEASPVGEIEGPSQSMTKLDKKPPPSSVGRSTPASGEIAIIAAPESTDSAKTRWEPKFEMILIALETSLSRAFFARSTSQALRLRFKIDPDNQRPIGKGESVDNEKNVSVLVEPSGRIQSFDPSEFPGLDLINAVFRSLEGKILTPPEEPLVIPDPPVLPVPQRAETGQSILFLSEYLKANQSFLIDHLNKILRGEHKGVRLPEGETIRTVFLFPDKRGRYEGIRLYDSQGELLFENIPRTILSQDSFVKLELNGQGRLQKFDAENPNESGATAARELKPFIESLGELDQKNTFFYQDVCERFQSGIYPGEFQKMEEGEYFTKALIVLDPEGRFVGVMMLSNITDHKARTNKTYKALPGPVQNLDDPHSPFKVVIVQVYPEGQPIKLVSVPSLNFLQTSALKAWFELARKKR